MHFYTDWLTGFEKLLLVVQCTQSHTHTATCMHTCTNIHTYYIQLLSQSFVQICYEHNKQLYGVPITLLCRIHTSKILKHVQQYCVNSHNTHIQHLKWLIGIECHIIAPILSIIYDICQLYTMLCQPGPDPKTSILKNNN